MTQARHPSIYYALYGDYAGTAERRRGGWLFRREGERLATVLSATDTQLVLLGQVDLVADTAPDTRPLWAQIADPGYYEGRINREYVRGR